jgi:drug/metabolite transporter (DMT)-like permease
MEILFLQKSSLGKMTALPEENLLHQQKKAYVYGLSAVLAWSTVATAFKISLAHLTPAQLVLYASLASTASLLGILLYQGRLGSLPALRQHWRRSLAGRSQPADLLPDSVQSLCTASGAGGPGHQLHLGADHDAAVGTLAQAQAKPERYGSRIICYLGVLVIGTHGQLLSLHFSSLAGVGYALASTLLWAAYWIFNARDQREPVLGLTLNFLLTAPKPAVLRHHRRTAYRCMARTGWCSLCRCSGNGLYLCLVAQCHETHHQYGTDCQSDFPFSLLSLGLIHFIVGSRYYRQPCWVWR